MPDHLRQPMTLLAPQANIALFLNYHGDLWAVPAFEPGRWDWRHAAAVETGNPIYRATQSLARMLRTAAADLHESIER